VAQPALGGIVAGRGAQIRGQEVQPSSAQAAQLHSCCHNCMAAQLRGCCCCLCCTTAWQPLLLPLRGRTSKHSGRWGSARAGENCSQISAADPAGKKRRQRCTRVTSPWCRASATPPPAGAGAAGGSAGAAAALSSGATTPIPLPHTHHHTPPPPQQRSCGATAAPQLQAVQYRPHLRRRRWAPIRTASASRTAGARPQSACGGISEQSTGAADGGD
jgi:hypothetical protein